MKGHAARTPASHHGAPSDDLADVVGRLHGRMVATAKRVLHDEDEANDAVQEAYVHALRALPDFERRAQLSTWLHRIVVNAALTRLRTRRRTPVESLEGLPPESPAIASPPTAVETEVDRGTVRRLVRRCVDDLPPPYRTVLVLRDLQDLDADEAADRLRLNPVTLRVRLHRARRVLRTRLAPLALCEALA